MAMALEQRLEKGAETTRSSLSRPPPTTQLHTHPLKTVTPGRQGLTLKHYGVSRISGFTNNPSDVCLPPIFSGGQSSPHTDTSDGQAEQQLLPDPVARIVQDQT